MKKKLALIIAIMMVTMMVFTSCDFFEDLFGSEVTYTVTLDANGGQLSGESSITVKEQSMVDLPSPKREGYVFLGWYLGEGVNETKFKSTDLVTSDITLKAKWMSEEDVNGGVKIEIHTVTLNANGGTLPGESIINAQTYSTLNLPTPTKEGHVFIGWYVGEGVNESLFTSSSLVTSDLTLNAKWAKADYTVTFVDYYGNVIKRDTVKYGEAANAPTVPRIAELCLRFDSWDTDISAVTSDMTVKALYVIDSYTITYVTNNTQTIPAASYFFDEIPATPHSPELAGHYFIGWYLDEEFTTEYKFDAPLTSNITLYAYFNEGIPISTLDELLAIPQYSVKNYFLKNDIDCDGAVINATILDFAGTLDGEGHKIHNFVFQPTAAANTGLFATNGGTIKNITFDNFSYKLTSTDINNDVGFVVGKNSGTVENVHITNASLSYTLVSNGNITSYYGVICGENDGEVNGCSVTASTLYLESQTNSWWNSGTKYSYLYGGALVGLNDGSIQDSEVDISTTIYNRNNCSSDYYSGNQSYMLLGGLASINNGNIKSSDADLTVSGSTNNYRTMEASIGGFVCKNKADIEGCSASAKITLNDKYSWVSAAGFAENSGTINNSYANVEITNSANNTNSRFGGFVSYNTGGVNKCYATGDMNVGAATQGKGGFAGYNNGNITASFAAVNITATDSSLYGPFVGNPDTASIITNCYYKNNATFVTNGSPQLFETTYSTAITTLNLVDASFLTDTLGWSADVWSFDANKMEYPTLK